MDCVKSIAPNEGPASLSIAQAVRTLGTVEKMINDIDPEGQLGIRNQQIIVLDEIKDIKESILQLMVEAVSYEAFKNVKELPHV